MGGGPATVSARFALRVMESVYGTASGSDPEASL